MHLDPPFPTRQPLDWRDLRPVALFQALSDAQLQDLAAHVRWMRLGAGQTLVDAAEDDAVNLVVRGALGLFFFGSNGRELQLGQLSEGRLLRNVQPMKALGLHLTLVAEADTVVARIPHDEMEAVCLREPQVLMALMQLVQDAAWMLVTRVLSLGALNVADRLRVHLLSLALQAGVQHNQAVLNPAPRQTQLAALLACSREEVARDMARLKRLGWLRRESGQLILTDVQALRASVGVTDR
ncbi:hypothetical protein CCO03_12010 [Comamonas serinivorans]|uniref:HTH crp-type domain-containing protein n=1 Tax=Comamonas serinivorans TaxID=1082851 RepID=A0A1Y0EPI3_9BURK|nr:Crp/Fnr family transcriptional regulator [Comamonas serinivorans]ARU05311.1 hypothetical protein CCO03_12010 [Comamonas serinivorans]